MKLKRKASAIFRAYIQFFEPLQYTSSSSAFYKLLCFSGSNKHFDCLEVFLNLIWIYLQILAKYSAFRNIHFPKT